MAASSDSDKKFMALVTESDSGTTIKKIQNEPGTVQETKIKLKAQKLEVKATKQRLKDMKNAEIESSTRGFKRPLWAQANSVFFCFDFSFSVFPFFDFFIFHFHFF